MSDIVSANINDVLDKIEDPEKMINLMIGEIEETVISLKASIAEKEGARTTLSRQIKECEEAVKRWSERSRLAVEKGSDELAREAIKEKLALIRQITSLKESLSNLESIIASLKEQLSKAVSKLEEMKEKESEKGRILGKEMWEVEVLGKMMILQWKVRQILLQLGGILMGKVYVDVSVAYLYDKEKDVAVDVIGPLNVNLDYSGFY